MYLKSYIISTAKKILIKFPKKIIRFFTFIGDYFKFNRLSKGRFSNKLSNVYPCLNDKISTTPFDHHYTYHPAWAARVLASIKPAHHIDISSIISFSTITSAFIPITFYDYRPAQLKLSNFDSQFADLTQLPFQSNSVESISCMHTIEHIGLGRYGDPISPDGDITAIKELIRVTKPNGNIIFVTPVGKAKIEFNAHRIYSFEQIEGYFENCHLKEFSLIPDAGGIITNADPKLVSQQNYGCGCFWFIKK